MPAVAIDGAGNDRPKVKRKHAGQKVLPPSPSLLALRNRPMVSARYGDAQLRFHLQGLGVRFPPDCANLFAGIRLQPTRCA